MDSGNRATTFCLIKMTEKHAFVQIDCTPCVGYCDLLFFSDICSFTPCPFCLFILSIAPCSQLCLFCLLRLNDDNDAVSLFTCFAPISDCSVHIPFA